MATERVTVNIKGMTCAGCVAHIEQELRRQEGVIWASINFAAGQATLTYDPTAFGIKRLARLVGELGYELQVNTAPNGEAVSDGAGRAYNRRLLWWPLTLGVVAALVALGLYLGLVTLDHGWRFAADLLWRNPLAVAAVGLSLCVTATLYVRQHWGTHLNR